MIIPAYRSLRRNARHDVPAIRDIIDDSCPLVNLKNRPGAAEAAAYIRKTATCGFGTCVLPFFCGNNDGEKIRKGGMAIAD